MEVADQRHKAARIVIGSGLDIGRALHPAVEVGGDYIDLNPIADDCMLRWATSADMVRIERVIVSVGKVALGAAEVSKYVKRGPSLMLEPLSTENPPVRLHAERVSVCYPPFEI